MRKFNKYGLLFIFLGVAVLLLLINFYKWDPFRPFDSKQLNSSSKTGLLVGEGTEKDGVCKLLSVEKARKISAYDVKSALSLENGDNKVCFYGNQKTLSGEGGYYFELGTHNLTLNEENKMYVGLKDSIMIPYDQFKNGAFMIKSTHSLMGEYTFSDKDFFFEYLGKAYYFSSGSLTMPSSGTNYQEIPDQVLLDLAAGII